MAPNQIYTVGLLPGQRLVSLQTDEDGNWKDVPDGQTVVPLVKVPRPHGGPPLIAEPMLVWHENRVERDWAVRIMTQQEQTAAARKVWKTSGDFLTEFTFDEMAKISLSQNPTIAAMRLLLASWAGEVWSNDQRVKIGLDALVEEGIIDVQRQVTILSK